MEKIDLNEYLASNEYPGRGIAVAMAPDGRQMFIGYFIMGRSENSRNRVFTAKDGGIITEAADPSKLEDPSLIIYAPVRVLGKTTIVTNGDQTDTIVDYLKQGKSYFEALRTREFEPDAPNYTPRISGVVKPNGDYNLSILKSNMGRGDSCLRYFFEYAAVPGLGHLIHTYKGDGDPIPSFEGEPVPVEMDGDLDSFTQMIWDSLNEDNKVSLFTRFIDLESGKAESRIINKNK